MKKSQPPVSVSPVRFVGREAELSALADALVAGDALRPTVVLQGVGGVGKTALAAQLAAQSDIFFPGGVLWTDLPIHSGEPLPVLAAWARQCGEDVSWQPDLQTRARMVRDLLHERVAKRGWVLVVLDGVCERWLESARVLQVVCPPGVPLLLTTRDEGVGRGLGAAVHRLDVLSPDEALALLGALAGPAVGREPDAARRLAELVGGLPLALEMVGRLAALRNGESGFRLAGLGMELESLIAEAPEREGRPGLSACLSLGYGGLGPEVQRLFRALSVFAPAPLATGHVAAVTGWELAAVEERLAALVALSLVHRKGTGEDRPEAGDAWYVVHPLLRDYATALLEDAGEGPGTRAAHAAHYLDYAEAHGQPNSDGYDALEMEHSNVLAAIDQAYEAEQWAQVCRFVRALCDPCDGYLRVRGYWGELRARLEQGLEAARALDSPQDEAAFIQDLAVLAELSGDHAEAGRLYWQRMELAEELEDQEGVAQSLRQLGTLARNAGEYPEARRLYWQSLEIAEDLGDLANIASMLHELGNLTFLAGEQAEAQRLYQQSLEIAERLGDREGVASTLHQLGMLAHKAGEVPEAKRLYRRSLEIEQELGNRAGVAKSLHELGNLACLTGEVAEAQRLYQESLDISRELGDPAGVASTLGQLGNLACLVGEVAEAQRLYGHSLGILDRQGDRGGVAVTLHQLGNLAYLTGEHAEARRMYQQSLDIARELGDQAGITRTLGQLANLARVEGDLVEAEKHYRRSLGLCQESGDVITERITLSNLAVLCEDQGRLAEAFTLLGCAVEIDARVGLPELEADRRALKRVRLQMRPGCLGWIARRVVALDRALERMRGGRKR